MLKKLLVLLLAITLTSVQAQTFPVVNINVTGTLQACGNAGTSGQILTSTGSSTCPTWISPSSSGTTLIPAAVSSTGQTASISTTTTYAVPSGKAGFYRVSVDLITTTAGSAGTVSGSISWNNGSAGITTSVGPLSLATLGNEQSASFTFFSAASQNITYSTTVTGATGSPVYTILVRVEYLG